MDEINRSSARPGAPGSSASRPLRISQEHVLGDAAAAPPPALAAARATSASAAQNPPDVLHAAALELTRKHALDHHEQLREADGLRVEPGALQCDAQRPAGRERVHRRARLERVGHGVEERRVAHLYQARAPATQRW